jgi:hypothetical protein
VLATQSPRPLRDPRPVSSARACRHRHRGSCALAGCATRGDLRDQDRQIRGAAPGAASPAPVAATRGRAAAGRRRERRRASRRRCGRRDRVRELEDRLAALERERSPSGYPPAPRAATVGTRRSHAAATTFRRRGTRPVATARPAPAPCAGRRRVAARRRPRAGRSRDGQRARARRRTCSSSTASPRRTATRPPAAEQLRLRQQRVAARRHRALLGGALLRRVSGDQNQSHLRSSTTS